MVTSVFEGQKSLKWGLPITSLRKSKTARPATCFSIPFVIEIINDLILCQIKELIIKTFCGLNHSLRGQVAKYSNIIDKYRG